jgi:hypothetical protein
MGEVQEGHAWHGAQTPPLMLKESGWWKGPLIRRSREETDEIGLDQT